jgi:hypothetical protein
LFTSKPPAKGEKKGEKKEEKKAAADDRPAPPPRPADTAAELKRHMNAYWRRLKVCDRLRQIACDANDAELQRQADLLEARAWDIYLRHTAHLGGGMPPPPRGGEPADEGGGAGPAGAGREESRREASPGTRGREDRP